MTTTLTAGINAVVRTTINSSALRSIKKLKIGRTALDAIKPLGEGIMNPFGVN